MASSIKFQWYGERAMNKLKLGAGRGLDQCGKLVVNEAQRLIRSSAKKSSGRKGTGVSAPGQPPATQTGVLLGAFTVERKGLSIIIGNRAQHAKWLELGTQKMRPRPFMRPASANTKDKCVEAVGTKIRQATGYKKA